LKGKHAQQFTFEVVRKFYPVHCFLALLTMNELPVVMCSKAVWQLNCHLRLCCLKMVDEIQKNEMQARNVLVEETCNYNRSS